MGNRVTRIVLSAAVGAAGVGIALYFGRFVAAGAGIPFRASLQVLPFATSVAWWLFIGLLAASGLVFIAVRMGRLRFVLMTLAGFGLGGVVAAIPEVSRMDRNSAMAVLAVPVGGALAGLWMGLGARSGTRSIALVVVGAAAMYLARPFLVTLLPPSDWIALLLPGALIGAALAALAPDGAGVSASG